MIAITPSAKEQMDQYFADKEVSPIRVFLTSGCGGARLALALDTPTDADEVLEVEGYTLVMEKELYGQASPLTIDKGPMGFSIETEMELGGGGCSSCSSCG